MFIKNQQRFAWCLGIFIFLFFCLSSVEASSPGVCDSLEWMTVDSPLIIRGAVVNVQNSFRQVSNSRWITQEVTVKINELLKGDYPEKTITLMEMHAPDVPGRDWLESKAEMILFLHSCKDFVNGCSDPSHPWEINVDNLLKDSYPIKLTPNDTQVISSDLRVLKDPQEILQRIRDRVKMISDSRSSGLSPISNRFRLNVPEHSEAYKILYYHGCDTLWVPPDEEYKTLALKQIKSPNYKERIKGAAALGSYMGDDSVAALKSLLNDPGIEKFHDSDQHFWGTPEDYDGKPRYIYGVRKAAYQSLQNLGVEVDKPILEEKKIEGKE